MGSSVSRRSLPQKSVTKVDYSTYYSMNKTTSATAVRSKQIDVQIEADRAMEKKTLKILLLGGPESGKSTIFRQMRILHMDGFSELDTINYGFVIHSNIIQAVQQLISACKQLNLPFSKAAPVKVFEQFYKAETVGQHILTSDICATIKCIWQSQTVQEAYNRRNEFTLLESAYYYLENLDRISASDYKPTNQDILRARTATTGIHEIKFHYKQVVLRMVDVGGQKSEQRKWFHCFDNVNTVLFIASIAGFNRTLEQEKENSLLNSLSLFGSVCDNGAFQKAGIIVFLNKIDIFCEMVSEKYPLTLCFPEYKGSNRFEEASHYIQYKFDELSGNKIVYTHFTIATDTDNVARIFESCMHVILRDNLTTLGLY